MPSARGSVDVDGVVGDNMTAFSSNTQDEGMATQSRLAPIAKLVKMDPEDAIREYVKSREAVLVCVERNIS